MVYAGLIPLITSLLMILIELMQSGMEWDLSQMGIMPRQIESCWSIFTVAFIHANWIHLANNVFSFFILSVFLFYFYRYIATKIFLLSYFFSGLILWIIGRDNYHVGASGWIYAIAFFLFFSGMFRKIPSVTSISFIVVLFYGSMIWHIFPWQYDDPISWEGHLSGGIVGLALAFIFRKAQPQAIKKDWGDENEEEEYSDQTDGHEEKYTDRPPNENNF